MATFAEMKDTADSPDLVRKPLQGVGFWAPMSATLPDTLLDSGGTSLVALDPAYLPIGIVSTDGYTLSRDLNKEETPGYGYSDPIRIDLDKAPKTVKVTPLQKWTRLIQELTQGADYSAVTATAAGEVVYEEPDIPELVEGRLIFIGFDGTAAKPFYRAYGFTKVTATGGIGDDVLSAAAEAAGQEITFDVGVGPEGFPVRHYLSGAAFDAAKFGFQPYSGV